MREELFNELIESMKEAADHSRGKVNLKTTTRMRPPTQVKPRDIIALRSRLQVSQPLFASMLNVSVKTIQAWEQGTRKPHGPALKLLEIARLHPEVLYNKTAGV